MPACSLRLVVQVPALRVVQGDILRVNLPQLLADMQQHWEQQQVQQQQPQGGSSSSSSAAGGSSVGLQPRPVKVPACLSA
jgi:hypothetical protein